MAHFPDHIRKAARLRPDIYFAGHTHGGQICLPNGFAPVRHDSLPRAFCKGVHRIHDTWFIVGRGMGFTGLPFALFLPGRGDRSDAYAGLTSCTLLATAEWALGQGHRISRC